LPSINGYHSVIADVISGFLSGMSATMSDLQSGNDLMAHLGIFVALLVPLLYCSNMTMNAGKVSESLLTLFACLSSWESPGGLAAR